MKIGFALGTAAERGMTPAWFVAPLLVVGLLFGTGLGAGCNGQTAEANAGAATAAEVAPKRTVAVRTTGAAERAFEARVTLKGDVQAQNFAFVGAKIPGVLDEVLVDVGAPVVAGETVLFRTDRSKLEKAVEAQRAALALAKIGIQEKQAVLEQLRVALDKAEADYNRHKSLRSTKSVSQDQFERVQTGYRQAKAASRHGTVLVELAREQKRQAEVALAIVEKDLADTEVKAPISGVVSDRRMEPGETAAPGMPFIRITDIAALRVSAQVPADHYARVVPGETTVRAGTGDIDLGVLTVSYRAPVIDQKTRTFEIRADLPTDHEGVAAGALVDLELLLAKRRALGVPQSAVIERGGETVIFVAENGVARPKTIRRGLETDGWVELREAPIAAGTAVITDGQTLVDDGTPLKVLAAPTAAVPAGGGD